MPSSSTGGSGGGGGGSGGGGAGSNNTGSSGGGGGGSGGTTPCVVVGGSVGGGGVAACCVVLVESSGASSSPKHDVSTSASTTVSPIRAKRLREPVRDMRQSLHASFGQLEDPETVRANPPVEAAPAVRLVYGRNPPRRWSGRNRDRACRDVAPQRGSRGDRLCAHAVSRARNGTAPLRCPRDRGLARGHRRKGVARVGHVLGARQPVPAAGRLGALGPAVPRQPATHRHRESARSASTTVHHRTRRRIPARGSPAAPRAGPDAPAHPGVPYDRSSLDLTPPPECGTLAVR